MSNAIQEIYRAHRDAQNRYTYFLLAAAGAAIALAVNQTRGSAIAWSQAPLAGAVLLWGASFFCGCRHLSYVISNLYANFELLRVENGNHPRAGNHPALVAAASEGIRTAMEGNNEKACSWGIAQFRLLAAGAMFYVLWHVLDMYLRRFPVALLC